MKVNGMYKKRQVFCSS